MRACTDALRRIRWRMTTGRNKGWGKDKDMKINLEDGDKKFNMEGRVACVTIIDPKQRPEGDADVALMLVGGPATSPEIIRAQARTTFSLLKALAENDKVPSSYLWNAFRMEYESACKTTQEVGVKKEIVPAGRGNDIFTGPMSDFK